MMKTEMITRPGNIYKMAKIKEIIDIIYMFRSKLVDIIYIKWSNPGMVRRGDLDD